MTKAYSYKGVVGDVIFTSGVKRTIESIQWVRAPALLDTEEDVPAEKVDVHGRYFPPLPPVESE